MSNQPNAPQPQTMISVIVPTYRESANLVELARRIFAATEAARLQAELLIVDDDSQDGTEQVVGQLIAEGLAIRLIVRRGQRGLASAVLRGFAEAQGRWLLVMDADLSHPPEKIPEMMAPLQAGHADFVIGSRYVPGGGSPGWAWHRRLISRSAALLARPFTNVKDPTAGFFALGRETWQSAAGINVVGYKIALELLVKCRPRKVTEVPITFVDRKAGQSKLTAAVQWQYLRHLGSLFGFRWPVATTVLRHAAVGGLALLADLLLLNLFLLAGASFLWARPGSAMIALLASFGLHRRWTCLHPAGWRRLPGFLLAALPAWTVNSVLAISLYASGGFYATHWNVAAVAGVLAGTAANLLVYRWPALRRPGRPGIQHLWEQIASHRSAGGGEDQT